MLSALCCSMNSVLEVLESTGISTNAKKKGKKQNKRKEKHALTLKSIDMHLILFCLGTPQRSHIELPFYSKYLLLAAYMASYNPARTDKRFFSKQALKMSNRGKAAAKTKKTKIISQLAGGVFL